MLHHFCYYVRLKGYSYPILCIFDEKIQQLFMNFYTKSEHDRWMKLVCLLSICFLILLL